MNSTAQPAKWGELLHIFGTGRGAVSPPVADGAAAGTTLSTSATMPNVFLNGQQMQVPFSALAPGAAGLWQIDIAIPGDGPTGSALPLVVESWLRSSSIPVAVSR